MATASPPPPSMVVKNRFLRFLIWQSVSSALIFFFFRFFIHQVSSSAITAPTGGSRPRFSLPFLPSFSTLFTFLTFNLAQLLFSASLSFVSSPQFHRPAYPLQLALGFFRLLLVSGGFDESRSADFRLRAKVSLRFVLFAVAAAVSGLVAVASVCWVNSLAGLDDGVGLIGRVGFRGFLMGLLYGLHYVYKRRWVLEFPIIQRPPFFSFKMGLTPATTRALKLSSVAYLLSTALALLLPDQFTGQVSVGKFICEQLVFYLGSFAVFLSWELSHQLHQVLHTKRFMFAPPKGSAAAETNPSEPLLAALEESNPGSLLQYLAYLDLCMFSENNVDIWRRAAFFEESGETYKRVIAVGLRPLQHLASKLSEALECSIDKNSQLSNQLLSPTDVQPDPNCSELLNNFQLYTWCARIVASLTARSHQEDRYGVAQLSGSNADVTSTLISCLLAVESFMGRNINVQSPNNLMGPGGIKWATSSMRRPDIGTRKKRGGLVHSKAYAIADVLRTSIYHIVSAFHDEMVASAKAGLLDKDWIITSKPPFGSRELLLQKLRLFLDFRAT
ncbi:Nucleoporin protein Ndc1-Nup [Parasponia andersonii]|uniref:Nucleoporin protein Ndc1-Nup n=1 Tax=Parasponia andersonii TaxID=3476 RepID=A0A2P5AKK6_PARAD|nr:Nucleoporin protein Ndc1-Nup [Parasponia andersonii]